ncbi:MAG: phosphatidate cytidylyltransferase [gamma proteobacterium symbiont of Bathyaustriella thionipta]|nr:phosphatidate cytidylyltransferase [gamma proteobacterium symbiont of Bathyaustriella thionipta]MCU7948582.1 phosphatidate cytidylyltransferase [gamma proteobacterium symbiont of Bathyaustriella thionipta]MCU7953297.1 phosphatidate cytidylyltransferase [gamma proteobacterium symbiont of Bathyaustriella thionipta]MCU7955088.1 phosphatidate cytidylyltransferase [gamma proteobacterium symbiont of Bathyaustriella thionipta]MCU7967016.1 phosphatidate cytidylyltransferase [gamma proteobacterium sy
MLKSRVITALLLFPLAVYGILFLSNSLFAAFVGFIILLGAYEWAGFAKFPSTLSKLAYVVIIGTIIFSLWLVNFILSSSMMNQIAVGFWLFALILLSGFPEKAKFWHGSSPVIAIIGAFLLVLTWYALISIHAIEGLKFAQTTMTGPYLVFSVMMLVWIADTGAYFSGKRFGKNKLAPKISPGKSREGVYGGLILAAIIVSLFTFWHGGSSQDYLHIIGISLVTVVFSVIGDLLESMFKRQANIKDSSNLLPGHGGILDRIDSVTAAGPVFYITLSWMYQLN